MNKGGSGSKPKILPIGEKANNTVAITTRTVEINSHLPGLLL